MPRRFALALSVGLSVGVAACRPGEPPDERPNVVVVVVDTLRADRLAPYGYGTDTAPFLTSLAARSVVFDQAWSTSSWTAPATASIFTGLYPSQHGVITGLSLTRRNKVLGDLLEKETQLNTIPPEVVTLPELFAAEGYRTYGTAANPNLNEAEGFAEGFGRFAPSNYADATHVVDRVLAWKEELRGEDAPFFLYVHLMDPHEPYHDRGATFDWASVPAELEPAVRGLIEESCERCVACGGAPALSAVRALDPFRESGETPNPATVDAVREQALRLIDAFYDSEIALVDRELERMFDELDLERDSIVVFTSDHGEELGERGNIGHGFSLHEELVGIPLWMRLPGADAPRGRSVTPASLIDLHPTLVDLVGATTPVHRVAGRSLAGEVRDPSTSDASRPLLAMRAHERPVKTRWMRAVLRDDTKLIVETPDPPLQPETRRRLFDLGDDRDELRDLAAERAADVADIERLMQELETAIPAFERRFVDFELDDDLVDALGALGYVEDDDGK